MFDGNELELSKLLLDDELVEDVMAKEAVVSGVSRYERSSIGSTTFSGRSYKIIKEKRKEKIKRESEGRKGKERDKLL